MLKTRIIPCLDVADGRVVKGVNFVDLIDAGDPVEAAKAYDAAGADELCFLDIHATHENRGTMFDLVTRTAEQCFMPLTVGGGVRTHHDVRALLLAGAYLLGFPLAAGAFLSGGLAAGAMLFLSERSGLKVDVVIGLIFAATPEPSAFSASIPALVRISMPCLVSEAWRNSDTSSSSTGTIRGSISTTVTFAPMSL